MGEAELNYKRPMSEVCSADPNITVFVMLLSYNADRVGSPEGGRSKQNMGKSNQINIDLPQSLSVSSLLFLSSGECLLIRTRGPVNQKQFQH